MNNDQYKEQLRELRKQYINYPEDREEIKKRAEDFKNNYGCYQCRENYRGDSENDLFPFCSQICSKAWADAHYNKSIDGRPRTIEDMQERILEIRRLMKYE